LPVPNAGQTKLGQVNDMFQANVVAKAGDIVGKWGT